MNHFLGKYAKKEENHFCVFTNGVKNGAPNGAILGNKKFSLIAFSCRSGSNMEVTNRPFWARKCLVYFLFPALMVSKMRSPKQALLGFASLLANLRNRKKGPLRIASCACNGGSRKGGFQMGVIGNLVR